MTERDDPSKSLLSTLPPDVRDDAQRLYDEIGRTMDGGPDPRDVVAELHRRGLLDESQLKDAVLALEASLRVQSRGDGPPASSAPQVLGRLGAGAMGEVLIAKDPGLNRVIAVKRLHPEGARRKALLRRFYREAQVTAQLDHPSIVPIHGLIEDDDGGLAYAMKLVRGRTLEDYLEEANSQYRTRGGPDQEHALPARLERFLHVCDALAYAHERGVLHRDLKPENIMVGAFGEVLVMDWGIAKLIQTGDSEDAVFGEPTGPGVTHPGATRVGTVMGTPRYMSPEQAEGRTDIIDPRSDQYSLGLILFEVVSLTPAIQHDLDLEGALSWARQGRKQALKHAHGDAVPRELAAIVDKATQPDRDQRYPSVGELAEDIRRYLRDEQVLARPDSALQRMQRWLGRHRQLAFNLMLLLLLCVLGIGAVGAVGIVGTASALTYRSQVREQRLAELNQVVIRHARRIETSMHRIEGQVQGVAYAASYALTNPATPPPGWDPMRDNPPDRRKGARYNLPVAVDWPSLASEGRSPARRDVLALASLGPQLSQALAESTPRPPRKLDAAARHKLVAEEGTPVVWARVGTVDGLVASSPGTTALRTGVADPRKEGWYTAVKRAKEGEVVWTGPIADPRGQGLVLTASVPVRDANGRPLGVASLDVTLDHLVGLIRTPPEAEGAWLLDAKGRVVAHNTLDARNTHTFEPTPFHRDEVWQASRKLGTGRLETSDGQIALWARLPSLDMTYVVVAPYHALTTVRDERREERQEARKERRQERQDGKEGGRQRRRR